MQSIYPVLKYDDARAAIEFLEGDDRFNQGAGRYSLYVVVEDPDAHYARAKEAGASSEREARRPGLRLARRDRRLQQR
jgi:hypothetical protein